MTDTLHSGALLSVALAIGLMLVCVTGAAVVHYGSALLWRWRADKKRREEWRRLLK